MKDYSNLSEEELERLITEKYGNDWTLDDLDTSDPLCIAFIKSIETGVKGR